jgi:serine-type D-Ala-D-Ala carboxypeptidase (penicillin-binding protein 5/6)
VVIILGAAGVAAWNVTRPLPSPSLVSSVRKSTTVPGHAAPLPWPVVGQGAVSVPSTGYAAQSGPETSLPIASLTKMTTAVVVLRDHPIAPGGTGPVITITPGDANQYSVDLDNDESNIPLQTGETLTELQLLEALLTQSANDVAYTLAVWDAGSEPAFVTKMNALAASLGAQHTHYVDASGFDPQSVSTAADCLRIAAAGMSIPAFAEVVGMSTVTLPLVGTAHNIVSEIGSNGVIGIKSGYTSQAGGCMVLAADRTVFGRTVLVLSAVLDQVVPPPKAPAPTASSHSGSSSPSSTTTTTTAPAGGTDTTTTASASLAELQYPLLYAGPIAEKLLDAAESAVVPVRTASAGDSLASVVTRWNGQMHQVDAVATTGAWLIGWPGQKIAAAISFDKVAPGTRARARAGVAYYALGTQIESVPLTLTSTLPEPTTWWRVVHG